MNERARPLLSLCMIVRDEAERLPACLRSVAGLVDEVVLLDTGSTDATLEVAREHGCRIFSHTWQDDFAAARNASLAEAHGRYILALDADELLGGGEGSGFDLRQELRQNEEREPEKRFDFGMLRVVTPDWTGEREEAWAIRLLRNDRGFRYRHPVHEQLETGGSRVRELPLTVLHLGCLEEEPTRRRQARYLELLDRLPRTDPHRIVFTVRGLVSLGRWGEVEPWAQLAYELLPVDHPALPRLLFQAAVAAFNCDERQATAVWLRRGLARYPEHPDLHFAAMAHQAWLCKLAHQAVQDPGHPLFRQVGDSARWLGAIDAFLTAIGVRGQSHQD